ncbi:MAG: hypothetical protein NTW96_10085 [Planctomycetia bacterium]|nr:hypothetical protein [Planctomycetia bacterium]
MKRIVLSIAFLGLFGAGLPLLGAEIAWKHPGGMIDEATLLRFSGRKSPGSIPGG